MTAPPAAPPLVARLRLPAPVAARIRDHARATSPDECCGFLLGTLDDRMASVREAARALNRETVAPGGQGRSRFEIAPSDVVAAHREAARRGLAVVGYYHSHPRGQARPSARDELLAWAGLVYLIVGKDGALRAFVSATLGGRLEEIALEREGEDAA